VFIHHSLINRFSPVDPGELTNLNQQLHIINMASATVQTSYGHCDTFFVEGYEDTDGIFARAAAERERARAIAKVQQRHMAANLSRQTSELYLNDVLDHMEVMEVSPSDLSSI
jgi:precorrin-6B methylase 2